MRVFFVQFGGVGVGLTQFLYLNIPGTLTKVEKRQPVIKPIVKVLPNKTATGAGESSRHVRAGPRPWRG